MFDRNNPESLAQVVPLISLVRDATQGAVSLNYHRCQAYARLRLAEGLRDLEFLSAPGLAKMLQDAQLLAFQGKTGEDLWYVDGRTKRLQTSAEIRPGEFREGGPMISNYVNEGLAVEKLAIAYGDAYRTQTHTLVCLDGIDPRFLPQNIRTIHCYPPSGALPLYVTQMSRVMRELTQMKPGEVHPINVTRKVAELYRYAANARFFLQVNNSLNMNLCNAILERYGLKQIPHGKLDFAAQRFVDTQKFCHLFYDHVMQSQDAERSQAGLESCKS
jgi:hypothetical protein